MANFLAYLSPYGKISRREWWLHYFLPGTVIQIVTGLIDLPESSDYDFLGIFILIALLAATYFVLAGTARRARALNRTPLGSLVIFVPLIGTIIAMIVYGGADS